MTLKLLYKAGTHIPVELEGLTPTAVCGQSLAQVEQFPIWHGNQKITLAELFKVTGDASNQRIELEGNLAGVHWIGAGMTTGEMHVAGNAGRHAGSQLRGGELHVHGSTGDWAGAEMRGGLIHVRGSAGHLLGAAYRGSPRGMTGGAILVDGDAGDEIGHTMRRGLLAIGGACGDFAGINMIAGSILVFGACGLRTGAGMRRGTVALLGREPEPFKLLPSFRFGGCYEPLFLQLMLRELRRLEFKVADDLPRASHALYHGDLLTGGRGEILLRNGDGM